MKTFLILLIIALTGIIANADDRMLFGLKGPVKRAEYSIGFSHLSYPEGESNLREFTPDGDYIYFKDSGTDQVELIREKDKVTAKISHWGDLKTLTWETISFTDKTYVTSFTSDEDDVKIVYYLIYDNGNLLSESIRNEWKDGRDNTYSEIVYKVLEKDKYGNWTKRKAVFNRMYSEIETCKLEYYPEVVETSSSLPVEIATTQSTITPINIEEEIVNIEEDIDVSPKLDYNAIFDDPEIAPAYPGGTAAIFSHIARKMRYPLIAQENGIQGKVIVGFIVEKDGSLSNIEVLESIDPNLDKEALRVINALEKFSPGKMHGTPVRTSMTLPVTFKLK